MARDESLAQVIGADGSVKFSSAGLGRKPVLTRAELAYADLNGAELRNANLRHADLCNADLCSARFDGATLTGADATLSDTVGAFFPNARMDDMRMQ